MAKKKKFKKAHKQTVKKHSHMNIHAKKGSKNHEVNSTIPEIGENVNQEERTPEGLSIIGVDESDSKEGNVLVLEKTPEGVIEEKNVEPPTSNQVLHMREISHFNEAVHPFQIGISAGIIGALVFAVSTYLGMKGIFTGFSNILLFLFEDIGYSVSFLGAGIGLTLGFVLSFLFFWLVYLIYSRMIKSN